MGLKTDDHNSQPPEVTLPEEQKPKRGPGRPRKTPIVQSDSTLPDIAFLKADKKSFEQPVAMQPEQIGDEDGGVGLVGSEPSFDPVLTDVNSDSVAKPESLHEPVSPENKLDLDPAPISQSEYKEVGAKQSTQIHLIDGEKGGVGKSLFARVLVQFFQENSIPFVAVETDRSNKSLAGFYSDCQEATFSEDENLLDKADDVYNFALKKSVIVDLPAQAYRPVRNWIEKNSLLTLAQDDDVSFYKWFVCDGGYDSLNLLKQSLEELEADIQHILVKNLGKCEDWTHLDNEQEWQSLLAAKNVEVISFPKFYHMERNRIDMKRLTWNDALVEQDNPAGFHSISRSRIKSFLRSAHAQIAQLKLFGGTL